MKAKGNVSVTYGNIRQWCRVTYTINATTGNGSPRLYTMWIECTRSGGILKS